eukprot:CAMPEP_0184369596 /NCGR_PEP_ID=MMETSP1089-20130417/162338_1 /TAXON_ID=38269 ORGANISM="Gloeochaete wittrockiana, Strain SAG46.84" /NCGR_SAMPLE_ID=MMETSP1089 /ASSEMBLY_ACC=CAM_ASM_000445 /LENGTH=353 /DNA_ID=CAMNT_0026712069 /DNA_START=227 /DNA_END=1285 /DNA_ORIENTATION=-
MLEFHRTGMQRGIAILCAFVVSISLALASPIPTFSNNTSRRRSQISVSLTRLSSVKPSVSSTLSPTTSKTRTNTPSASPKPSRAPTGTRSRTRLQSNAPTVTPSPPQSPSSLPTYQRTGSGSRPATSPTYSPSPSRSPANQPAYSASPSKITSTLPTYAPSPYQSPSNLPTSSPSPSKTRSNLPTSSPSPSKSSSNLPTSSPLPSQSPSSLPTYPRTISGSPPPTSKPTPRPIPVIVPWRQYKTWLNDEKAQPSLSLVSVSAVPTETEGLNIRTLDDGVNPWDTGVHWPTIVSVRTTDVLQLSFYARKLSPTSATVIRTQVLFEENYEPYTRSLNDASFLVASTSWALFTWTF